MKEYFNKWGIKSTYTEITLGVTAYPCYKTDTKWFVMIPQEDFITLTVFDNINIQLHSDLREYINAPVFVQPIPAHSGYALERELKNLKQA